MTTGGGVDAVASRVQSLSPDQRALLLQRLRERAGGAAVPAGADARVSGSATPVLSFAQERMWLLAELTPGLSAYNTARVVRLRGRLDVDRLQQALDAALRDHEVLRTRVRRGADGHPEPVLVEASVAGLEVAAAPDETIALRLVERFIARPFDLGHDDLLRALVVRIGDELSWLALSLHHIASDEASRAVLWKHLATTYSGSVAPEPPGQYSTFASRQRHELDGPRLAEETAWWRRHLVGAPTVVELPTDHVRPALQTYRGRRLVLPLDADLLAILRDFGAARSTTVFTTVVGAFAWLMSRWTREEQLVLGMPVSGRDHPGAQGLIGLFVNTVVLRSDCSGRPSFDDLVNRTRETMLASLAHQEVPFEKVVEAVAPTRDLSRNPLFQLGVNSVRAEQSEAFAFGDLAAEALQVDPQTTKYDLGLLVHEGHDGETRLAFEFSADLFDDDTVAALAEQLQTLLWVAPAAPDRPLADLDLTPDAQRHRLVATANATAKPVPEVCLHDLMTAQAARTPHAEAVADADGSLTYAELDRRSGALARHLRGLGVRPGVLVGVGVPRSVAMEVAVWAILRAGGAYVPLDTTYPAERLAFMLEDSRAAVLITDRATRRDLPSHPVTVEMDDLDELVAASSAGPPNEPLDSGATPDDLCYVIYTSGSTGRPKGAELRHRGLVNRLMWMQDVFGLTATDTVLQKTPLSFDVSAWEVLWPVLVGARLFLARPGAQGDPAYLSDVIVRERVSVMHFVPSMLAAFLGSPAAASVAGGRLRAVVCSGEVLPQELKEEFFDALPDVELHNLYGPTEASIDVTWHRCRPGPEHRVRIGAPIDNVQTYVLDADRRPVPVGVPGELYLAGVQLARGYLGRPELTAERFVPLGLAPDQRAYRTGDLVRWTAHGEIDYLGRMDDQVKLRGFRIELGEIEAMLASHPDVAAACAAVLTLPSGEPTLAGYVVVRDRGAAAGGATADVGADDGAAQLDEWGEVWEDTYAQTGPPDEASPDEPFDPRFDTRGWVNSFTGAPYSAAEMQEWADAATARIVVDRSRPAVLEVGAGSGLVMWRVAPASVSYVATDFSPAAMDRMTSLLEGDPLQSRVRVLTMSADRVGADTLGGAVPESGFDVAVVNSVAQYFPARAYAADLVGRLRSLLAPGGRLFFGDVRDLRVHRLFCCRVETAARQRAQSRPGWVEPSPGELLLRIADRQQLDTELLFAPAFFAAVGTGLHLQVLPKRGGHATEMNDFRFDAVLSDLGDTALREVAEWSSWVEVGSLAALEDRLADLAARGDRGSFGVRGIPNARLMIDRAALDDLAAGRAPGATAPAPAVHPDELVALGERYRLGVELSALDDATTVAAAFRTDPEDQTPVRFPVAASTGGAPGTPESSDPVAARRLARQRVEVVRAVTELARRRLPEHMVPAAVRALPALPVGLSGKLDRAALPTPFTTDADRTAQAPRTELEQTLLELWTGLLGSEDLGVEDDFFRMGGHSLLAVRMLSAVARTLSVRLPLAAVFRSPTIAALALEIETAEASVADQEEVPGDDELTLVDRHPRRRALRRLEDPAELARAMAGEGPPDDDADVTVFPLSRAQQRMWFLDTLESGRPIYTVRRAYRARGPLDTDRLQASLHALVARHDGLRTLTRSRGEVVAAVVLDRASWPLDVIDFSAIPEPLAAVREHTGRVAAQPFDLELGPLLTAYCYLLGPDDAVLVLRMHHLLVDAWSLDVLIADLRRQYDALGTGAQYDATQTTAPLAGATPYPDVVVWEESRRGDEALERDLAYWRQQMAGAPAALELPTDHPRPAHPTSAGHRVSLPLGADLTDAVRRVAREHGATPFAVLLAACAALLSRLSGQDDIVVGTAVAGRQRPEVEHTVGLFANTLLLRTDTSGDPRFADLLTQAQATLADAQDHAELPFERLVEELSPERDLGRNPLFQVLLNLVPSQLGDVEFDGTALEPFELESPYTRFDLGFTITERAHEMVATLEYRTDLFEAVSIERLLERWAVVLRVATAQPRTRLRELPLLTASEEQAALAWGTHPAQIPPTTAVALIAAAVGAHPHRVAVRSPGRPDLSYGELWQRSGDVARWIATRTPAGSPVGVLVGRHPGLVVAALAVWRAGCHYLPLDDSYPQDRRDYMVEDSGTSVVLTDALLAKAEVLADVEVGADAAALPEVAPTDLAYVIYTSGSTGRPKGVEIEHGALANLLTAMRDRVGFDPGDRLAAVTTFSFDIAGLELFLPLVAGAEVVLLDRETAADARQLADRLDDHAITVLQATPATWRMLLADSWPGMPGLTALCGGEALTPDLAAALMPRVATLWNCYGPTETTIWSTVAQVDDPQDVTIGAPLQDTAVYVLDPHRALVPPGTTGELWIGGGGVARGYHDRPDLTADRFAPDPWQLGRRIYRTGDLAVWTTDGRLRCLGRTDNQVKLRGHRIELGEIEALVEAQPGIREAAVVLREDHPGDQRIVGYVVGPGCDAPGTQEALRAALPAYMVPSALVELAALPRTANNKIDRRALPAPVLDRSSGTLPRTDDELTVARIWADLLHVETVLLEDDFFDLGGHSLLATRLTSRLAAAFGIRVELRTVFEHPTLGAQTAALPRPDADLGPAVDSGPVPVSRSGRWLDHAELTDRDALHAAVEGRSGRDTGEVLVWPLSAAQTRMWLLHRIAPGDPRYHVPLLRRLRGPIDVDALRAAVQALTARHELLRTTYVQSDDVLAQVVGRTQASFHLVDRRGSTWDDVVARARDDAGTPFDLEHGPALRVTLTRVAEEEWLLLLVVHHIALDGWSIARLLTDLADLYAGSTLAPPDLQFGEYAVWEQTREVAADDVAFWAETLGGMPEETTFPTLVRREASLVPAGRRVRHRLPVDLADGVEDLAREHRATPFMVLTAALSILVGRFGAGGDVVLGAPVATRSFRGGEELVGPLINTVVLRVAGADDASLGDHLDGVVETCRAAYAHGGYPFERLVADLGVARSAIRHPVFQVTTSLQEAGGSQVSLGGALLEPVEIDWSIVHFDASFQWTRGPEGLELALEYRSDLYDQGFPGRLVDGLTALLGAARDDPAQQAGAVPLTGAADRRALTAWNLEPSSAAGGCAHELFAAAARRTPDAPAVGDANGWLTYRELDRRANRLAHHLVGLDVHPDDRVAICLERSVDLEVAVLGTLKAGAAFVPLDPSYPQERLALLLADSGAVAMLTDGAAGAPLAGSLPIVRLDHHDDWDSPDTPPEVAVGPDHLAYVLYTSGTTGRPKGVLVEHRNLVCQIRAVQSRLGIGPSDTWLQRVPFGFDPSVMELLVPVASGARLFMTEPGRHGDPYHLADAIQAQDVTVTIFVPSLLRPFLDAGVADRCRSLRVLICGGEVLTDALAEAWLTALPWTRLENMYGPTEATISVTSETCLLDREVTIGRPLPGSRALVLDEHDHQVPIGVTGELCLAGGQVARGYLDRAELTAEAFAQTDLGRIYRTGDLAVWRPDGRLRFVGRRDDQVKIRGHRVEPEEVAHALRSSAGVLDAAVVTEDGELVAYAVPADPASFDPARERRALRSSLPAHLVPAALIAVDELVLTPSGKIDRDRLRRTVRIPAVGDKDRGRPPDGPTEELVARMWADLLGLESVSADDDFFDLGGDSLTAARFVTELHGMGIELPMLTVFSHQTVAELAGEVAEILWAGIDADIDVDPADPT